MEETTIDKRSHQQKTCLVFILAAAAAFLWMYLSQFTEIWFAKRITNITTYVIFVGVFIVVAFVGSLLLPQRCYCSWLYQTVSSKLAFCIVLATVATGAAVLIWAFSNAAYCNAGLAAMQWAINRRSLFTFCVLGVLLVGYCIKTWKRPLVLSAKWVKATDMALLFLIFVCAAFVAWWAYTPNLLNYTWDYEAYWQSAFSLARGIPLTRGTSSVYGHYAFLMAPFFSIVGGFSPARVALLLSTESVLMFLCVCYTLWYVASSRLLRFLGVLAAMDYFFTVSTVEGQMTPHRVLFSAFLMAFAAFYLRNRHKFGKLFYGICIAGGYLIAILGLIWSTDSGLTGIAAWAAFHFYLVWTENPFALKTLLRTFLIVVCIVLCVVMAWQITSVLNVVVYQGEPISLSLFMVPLLPDDQYAEQQQEKPTTIYSETLPEDAAQSSAPSTTIGGTNAYLDMLQLPLVRRWTPWFAALALLFFGIAKGVATFSCFQKKLQTSPETAFGFFVSVLAAFLLLYFFNRVDYYNMSTAFFCILVVIVLFAQELRNLAKKKQCTPGVAAARGACIVSILLLVSFFSAAVGRAQVQLRKLENCHRTDVISTFFQETKDRIPQNAQILGMESTYYNSGLDMKTEDIIWFQWVNYLDHFTGNNFSIDTKRPIVITDTTTQDYLLGGNSPEFVESISKYYEACDTKQLNYINYNDAQAYELSKVLYLYLPKTS